MESISSPATTDLRCCRLRRSISGAYALMAGGHSHIDLQMAAIGLLPKASWAAPRSGHFFPITFWLQARPWFFAGWPGLGSLRPSGASPPPSANSDKAISTVRIKTKRSDEIGQLARTFNQMADRLERLIVSERRLLGDISHELRSPLARLKFAVKLARTSPDNKSALDRIERDVDRITSLVADIVEITFIEGDPTVQDTGIVRAGEIIDEVVRDCTLEAQFRDCSIEVQREARWRNHWKSGTVAQGD